MREKKADQTGEEPSITVHEPESLVADGAVDVKPKRSRGMGLIYTSMRRPRSHSRHSTVTDRGQTTESQDPMPNNDLSKIAPPAPGPADAAALTPERSASAVSLSLNSETHDGQIIITSHNPALPSTLIPATDTLTTRPTAGGIAYPFSLKVDGHEGKDVNASTLTLASVNITTPPAVDDPQIEMPTESMVHGSVNEQVLKEERPGIERYFTAAPTSGSVADGAEEEKEEEVVEKVERPPVERFETAQEDLTTLAASSSKV